MQDVPACAVAKGAVDHHDPTSTSLPSRSALFSLCGCICKVGGHGEDVSHIRPVAFSRSLSSSLSLSLFLGLCVSSFMVFTLMFLNTCK